MVQKETCNLCSRDFNPGDEPWSQYNWDIEDTRLCTECSQNLRWAIMRPEFYRIRVYSELFTDQDREPKLVSDKIKMGGEWIEELEDDPMVEVTIVSPPMELTAEYEPC